MLCYLWTVRVEQSRSFVPVFQRWCTILWCGRHWGTMSNAKILLKEIMMRCGVIGSDTFTENVLLHKHLSVNFLVAIYEI